MAGCGSAMLDLMAESGNGPVHVGRAVTVEGDSRFDRAAMATVPVA